jgi:hypothetical protein
MNPIGVLMNVSKIKVEKNLGTIKYNNYKYKNKNYQKNARFSFHKTVFVPVKRKTKNSVWSICS